MTSDTTVQRLRNLRFRLEGALASRREEGDAEAVSWLADGVAALNIGIDRIGAANLFEEMWRTAEAEAQRLEAGMKPSRAQIAEAFHEHRRERQTSLPPWSEVQEGSGAAQYAHAFVDRFVSITTDAEQSPAAPLSPDPVNPHAKEA